MAENTKKASFTQKDLGEDAPTREKKMVIAMTAKYDRKKIQARLELEDWVDEQLREMYTVAEDQDSGADTDAPELDLDEVKSQDEGDRATFIQNVLAGAKLKDKVGPFIAALLPKITDMATLN